jgi:hypothetical protein
MGFFSRIMDKLRGQSSGGSTAQQQQKTPAPGSQQQQYAPAQPNFQNVSTQAPAPLQNVDVDAVLANMAKQKGGGGNYRESIVDLLKLLDLDSSLDARRELAQELGVNAGAHGSAEQNIALQKAVMRKLAENGGKVPDSLKD